LQETNNKWTTTADCTYTKQQNSENQITNNLDDQRGKTTLTQNR